MLEIIIVSVTLLSFAGMLIEILRGLVKFSVETNEKGYRG